MRKLKLELDELSVETFAIDGPQRARGTVEGQVTKPTRFDDTCWASCIPGCGTYFCATQDASCGEASCVWSCAASCGDQASEPCYSCVAGMCG